MIRRLAFTAAASTDITDAYEWYESQRVGLGEEFQIVRQSRGIPRVVQLAKHPGVREHLPGVPASQFE